VYGFGRLRPDCDKNSPELYRHSWKETEELHRGVGLDFGTTNSAMAFAKQDGTVELATFDFNGEAKKTFRSVLYFGAEESVAGSRPHVATGHQAIEEYLAAPTHGRLIQSIKSYLASRLFKHTDIFQDTYTLEQLIALLLQSLRDRAESQFGVIGKQPVVVGRPVHFSGAGDEADDAFALSRLRAALERSGFEKVVFEYEPVAAAYKYQMGLDHEELVLIADFGGGTSDFSLIRLQSWRAGNNLESSEILGSDGVGIAGDSFDSKMVRELVSPKVGLNSRYRSAFGHVLRVPSWIFRNLERWHYLSFLKSKKNLELLREIRADALEPEKIQALIHIVDNDLGYPLYNAVEETKLSLSENPVSPFVFQDRPVDIEEKISRQQFDQWISPELSMISDCIDRLLQRCHVGPRDIDAVFITGGSSFVPAIRQIFSSKFGGPARLRKGDELTSVAQGLAIRAAQGVP
jgi:hypothetical chaperone protein